MFECEQSQGLCKAEDGHMGSGHSCGNVAGDVPEEERQAEPMAARHEGMAPSLAGD